MIKLSMTLNGETLEKEFANEKELIAAADEMEESRKKGKPHFKDSLHKEFYNMIQDNADGYRKNLSKKSDDTKAEEDLGFLKKAKVSASAAAAKQPRPVDMRKSTPKVSNYTEQANTTAADDNASDPKGLAELKYKKALAVAQAEAKEYQETVTRLNEDLRVAGAKHMDARLKFEEALEEYINTSFTVDDLYDILDSMFGILNQKEGRK